MTDPLLAQFLASLGAGDESAINLAGSALLIARTAHPTLDADGCLARLDAMAEDVRERLEPDYTPVDAMLELNQYLFNEQGFSGNRDAYYDPHNSFLNDVLERRTGIPITLSLLYLEIGWRIGLELEGVGFPGHFLVKMQVNEGEVFLDPFNQGASLEMEELEERAEQVLGGNRPLRPLLPAILAPVGKREILVRMLRNLKAVYLRRDDHQEALRIIEWLLACQPESAEHLRDRGLTYQALECARPALADLRRYLELTPAARDAEEIRARIIDLQHAALRLN